MIDKYQEALNNICKHCQSLMSEIKVPYRENEISNGNCGHRLCPYRHIDNSYCEDIETLQELINHMNFIDKYQTPDYLRVQNENEMLERALDLACEILEPTQKCLTGKTKEQWKECLFKESEKE